MKEEVEIENSKVHDEPVLLHKDECFDPGDDMHEVEVFLAMEISTNIEEGYIDSEGDVLFLDNLLCDELTPQYFSIMNPNHGHEEYLNRMRILCEIKASRSLGNFHASPSAIIESLPIPVEEKNEDNSILSPEEESFNVDHQDDPSIPRPPPEPPDVEKCLEPEAGILITKVFKGVSKPHDFMADILPTLPTLVSDLTFILFLSSFLSFGSEDTIFDPRIHHLSIFLSRAGGIFMEVFLVLVFSP
ncbi:hypothetical protein Tco_0820199 [Tanacetum coccineum]|uniref:Reverse transcriptase domain-containing protein n=1 Tax=Tanacetum coccineum TaxID=301880 RepID=A0ABQ5A8P6_9ASTR